MSSLSMARESRIKELEQQLAEAQENFQISEQIGKSLRITAENLDKQLAEAHKSYNDEIRSIEQAHALTVVRHLQEKEKILEGLQDTQAENKQLRAALENLSIETILPVLMARKETEERRSPEYLQRTQALCEAWGPIILYFAEDEIRRARQKLEELGYRCSDGMDGHTLFEWWHPDQQSASASPTPTAPREGK